MYVYTWSYILELHSNNIILQASPISQILLRSTVVLSSNAETSAQFLHSPFTCGEADGSIRNADSQMMEENEFQWKREGKRP